MLNCKNIGGIEFSVDGSIEQKLNYMKQELRKQFPNITPEQEAANLELYKAYLTGNRAVTKIDLRNDLPPVNERYVIDYERDIRPNEAHYVGVAEAALGQIWTFLLNGGAASSYKLPPGWTKADIPLVPPDEWANADPRTPDTPKNIDRIAYDILNNRKMIVLVCNEKSKEFSYKYISDYYPEALKYMRFIVQDESLMVEAATGKPASGKTYPVGHGNMEDVVYRYLGAEMENAGVRYIYEANADDLVGIYLPLAAYGYMLENGIEYAEISTPRTDSDIKGGIFGSPKGIGVDQAEVAMLSDEDLIQSQNRSSYPDWNTNAVIQTLATSRTMYEHRNEVPVFLNKDGDLFKLETVKGLYMKLLEPEQRRLLRMPRELCFDPQKTWVNEFKIWSDIEPKQKAGYDLKVDGSQFKTWEDAIAKWTTRVSLKDSEGVEIRGNVRLLKGAGFKGAVFVNNESNQQIDINTSIGQKGYLTVYNGVQSKQYKLLETKTFAGGNIKVTYYSDGQEIWAQTKLNGQIAFNQIYMGEGIDLIHGGIVDSRVNERNDGESFEAYVNRAGVKKQEILNEINFAGGVYTMVIDVNGKVWALKTTD
jgi:hypothetical protein